MPLDVTTAVPGQVLDGGDLGAHPVGQRRRSLGVGGHGREVTRHA